MKIFIQPVIVIVFIFIYSNSFAQIVNMEGQRFHRDSAGWSGSAGGNLEVNDYGQQVFIVNANAHVQYQNKKSLYLLLGNYGFLKGDGQSFIDNGFLHFRYNYKIGPIVRWEAFTQIQQNAITKIQSRFLIGTGPRFKIVSNSKVRLNAASLAMYENEKETGKQAYMNEWRSSSYVSLTYIPNSRTDLTTTSYYQPVFFNGKDYRFFNVISFNVKASNKLSLGVNWTYQYDSTPAEGIQKYNYDFSTGIQLSL